jgi:HK97 gp10 family phage protein
MVKSMNIIGAAEFKKALRDNATLNDLKKVVLMNGAELTSETQWNAPLDTGTLERSITQTIKDGGLTSVTEPHTEYDGYVEFGTRYMAAQPYLRPAFKKQSKKFKQDMERLVK